MDHSYMDDGRILAAHCDCKTCSHVASLLWVIGVGVESRESLTVTQKSAYWVVPPAKKSVPYSPVIHQWKILSLLAKRKNSEVSISAPAAKRLIPPPSNQELSQFFWEFGFLLRCKASSSCCSRGPYQRNGVSLVLIRCVVLEIQLFFRFFRFHTGLVTGNKISEVQETWTFVSRKPTQRMKTRLAPLRW